ncbi:MAG TPA: hypothetical protein VLG50_04570 [Candidatus Saccharimonadales bacterium]|nr:hypothetical protein [Candidatus Saccharimonadales bacterium]
MLFIVFIMILSYNSALFSSDNNIANQPSIDHTIVHIPDLEQSLRTSDSHYGTLARTTSSNSLANSETDTIVAALLNSNEQTTHEASKPINASDNDTRCGIKDFKRKICTTVCVVAVLATAALRSL